MDARGAHVQDTCNARAGTPACSTTKASGAHSYSKRSFPEMFCVCGIEVNPSFKKTAMKISDQSA